VKARTTQLVATIVLVFAAPSSLGAQPAPIPTSLGITAGRVARNAKGDSSFRTPHH
jgi:hypothetical protein